MDQANTHLYTINVYWLETDIRTHKTRKFKREVLICAPDTDSAQKIAKRYTCLDSMDISKEQTEISLNSLDLGTPQPYKTYLCGQPQIVGVDNIPIRDTIMFHFTNAWYSTQLSQKNTLPDDSPLFDSSIMCEKLSQWTDEYLTTATNETTAENFLKEKLEALTQQRIELKPGVISFDRDGLSELKTFLQETLANITPTVTPLDTASLQQAMEKNMHNLMSEQSEILEETRKKCENILQDAELRRTNILKDAKEEYDRIIKDAAELVNMQYEKAALCFQKAQQVMIKTTEGDSEGDTNGETSESDGGAETEKQKEVISEQQTFDVETSTEQSEKSDESNDLSESPHSSDTSSQENILDQLTVSDFQEFIEKCGDRFFVNYENTIMNLKDLLHHLQQDASQKNKVILIDAYKTIIIRAKSDQYLAQHYQEILSRFQQTPKSITSDSLLSDNDSIQNEPLVF